MDNTVNDLRYEIKFENCVKVKNNFFIKRNIAFLFSTKYIFYSWRHIFFKIPKNLMACSVCFFFVKVDTKNHRFASAKSLNAALVKLTD